MTIETRGRDIRVWWWGPGGMVIALCTIPGRAIWTIDGRLVRAMEVGEA